MIAGLIPCQRKPDLDNVLKAVLDGLNKVCWADDVQIKSKFAAPPPQRFHGRPRRTAQAAAGRDA